MFTCRHAPFELPSPVIEELARRYGEPHRAYHTAAHVSEMLGWFDVVAEGPGWRAPADIYVATLFHDAVYDARASSGANEHASAELARDLADASPRAEALIELTAQHGKLTRATLDTDADAAHFLDCDMAILAAAPAAFDAYDAAIAFEYAHVPRPAYLAARRAFLAGLLARPNIYLSPYFHDRLDLRARANLTSALAG